MPDAKAPDAKALGIVHVTRTPVGGIFRHILDVASGQAARGHRVGIVCEARPAAPRAEAALAAIAPQMKLGVFAGCHRPRAQPDRLCRLS